MVLDERVFSCCFTGYRPQKFPFALSSDDPRYVEFENRLITEIAELINENCLTFYSGMAMGFDIIAAECVLTVAKVKKDRAVRLICAIPFQEQAKSYPREWKERYDSVLAKSDQTVLISSEYYRRCYYDRNRFMVDNSDFVLTWFDGSPGGTKNTVDYAKSKLRKVVNLYTG